MKQYVKLVGLLGLAWIALSASTDAYARDLDPGEEIRSERDIKGPLDQAECNRLAAQIRALENQLEAQLEAIRQAQNEMLEVFRRYVRERNGCRQLHPDRAEGCIDAALRRRDSNLAQIQLRLESLLWGQAEIEAAIQRLKARFEAGQCSETGIS